MEQERESLFGVGAPPSKPSLCMHHHLVLECTALQDLRDRYEDLFHHDFEILMIKYLEVMP